ncbi:Calcium-dependent lipid-binding (CaLB domain) family protein [Thalictrum thalictroides]|uniref:Calcium-dependent lipid-binding (CaLB domain) family protein n=1 Tax=Thalictrum thalictroides TaxID=46969 RepID=A0A7J6XDU8_THATH|nr:Calcium-dependent lipid-binding (CaLB domain) family protein [Thalictrum thalictroides]
MSGSSSRIHGRELEITVVGCNNLENKKVISKLHPYVCLEYGTSKFKTSTKKGTNPRFGEKFVFTAIEGLEEVKVYVCDSVSLSNDRVIGEGSVQLKKVLSKGYYETTSTLQTNQSGGSHGRFSGEVCLLMHCPNSIRSKKPRHAPQAAPPASPAHPSQYFAPPSPAHHSQHHNTHHHGAHIPCPCHHHPPQPAAAYPPQSYQPVPQATPHYPPTGFHPSAPPYTSH